MFWFNDKVEPAHSPHINDVENCSWNISFPESGLHHGGGTQVKYIRGSETHIWSHTEQGFGTFLQTKRKALEYPT